MDLLTVALATATLLCSLVTGLLFSFAVVVMPGIKTLDDREFLKAFKVMDRVIQDNQPLFIVAWLGSILALVSTALLGSFQLDGTERILLLLAAGIYTLAVQLPTFAINIPLNNQLQARDLEAINEHDLQEARKRFEQPWVRWNSIRTFASVFTTTILIIVSIRQ